MTLESYTNLSYFRWWPSQKLQKAVPRFRGQTFQSELRQQIREEVQKLPKQLSAQERSSHSQRIRYLYQVLDRLPPAGNGLMMLAQLNISLTEMEDYFFGAESWQPPHPPVTERSPRMYPIYAYSYYPVEGYPGVTLMVSGPLKLFIGSNGSLEVQYLSMDVQDTDFPVRNDACVQYRKAGTNGQHVWDKPVNP